MFDAFYNGACIGIFFAGIYAPFWVIKRITAWSVAQDKSAVRLVRTVKHERAN